MQKVKAILSITLLVSVATSIGIVATRLLLSLSTWDVIPAAVAVWSGIALAVVYVFERGR